MPLPSPSSVLLRTQSDERLVVLARAGHERAFEAIVERYRGVLLRAARRYLPEARAEDALQQAYISAWSALRRGDEVRDLRAWLYRIVHNAALNQLRVSGYDYAELQDALHGTDAPQEEIERRAIVRQTLTGLAALPERQREALLGIAVEGRSQEEVARELGVTEGAVRQLVHRARLTLRAAATAVTPLPLAAWAAGASGAVSSQMTERIAELVGGAGASAFLTKAGTVAVLATGTAVAVPAIAPSGAEPPPRPKVERTVAPRPARTPAPRATRTASPAATPVRTHRSEDVRRPKKQDRPKRVRARANNNSGPGSSNSGPGSTDSGSGSSGSGHSGSGSGSSGSGSSGSGSSGSDSSGSGSSGSGPSGSGSSGSDSSGSGSGDGSGSSGSGSSGSGSSGSGPSGSGSSGSGSGDGSGSGSSGSGDGSGSSASGSGSGSSGSGAGEDNSGPGSGTDDGSSGSSGSGSGGSDHDEDDDLVT
jgi:RNA polymerase sigma factor (sigma-70 family)